MKHRHWKFWMLAGLTLVPLFAAKVAVGADSVADRLTVPAGYSVSVFAEGLGSPRLLQLTSSGDIIVSGGRDSTLSFVRADHDGDGKSDGTRLMAKGLNMPHGLVLEGNRLFVAESHRVWRFDFNDQRGLENQVLVLEGIPDGGGHSTRTLARGPDGFLYLSIGSTCNACLEDNPLRASLIRFKEDGGTEIFAEGLRNTVGFDWNPRDGKLYGVENGRDNLGDDVPDDELNRIEQGRHYGWPYQHGFGVEDPELWAERPSGKEFEAPVHGFGAHHAPLAIRFLRHQQDTTLADSALVTEHGSWNRTSKAGYRVMRVSFADKINAEPFLEGCFSGEEVFCRPVDIIEACDGTLYMSDDFGGRIFRIAPVDHRPANC